MTLEEIFDSWEKDSVTPTEYNIALESLKTPALHHKYHKILSFERLKQKQLEGKLDELKRIKSEYYMGTLDTETMKERGYRPFKIRVLKTDVSTYLNSDQEIIDTKMRYSISTEKVDALKSIIDMIMKRSFSIGNAIDMIKFNAGAV